GVVTGGLQQRRFSLRQQARRTDDSLVAERTIPWEVCTCADPGCRHNRIAWWLPPTGVWDQDTLACDVWLTSEAGDVVFADRLLFDLTPPPALQTPLSESGPAPREPPLSPEEVVDRFHWLYYYGSGDEHQLFIRTYWMNVPCVQCPLDLWAYQEILA